MIPSSPLSVIIAVPDAASHHRRLETSYTVQLGSLAIFALLRLTGDSSQERN